MKETGLPQNICDSCAIDLEEHVTFDSFGMAMDVDPPPDYEPCDLCDRPLGGTTFHSIRAIECRDQIASAIQEQIYACEEHGCGLVEDDQDEEELLDETNGDLFTLLDDEVAELSSEDPYGGLLLLLRNMGVLDKITIPDIKCPNCGCDFDDWYRQIKTKAFYRTIPNVPTLPREIDLAEPPGRPADLVEYFRSDCSNSLIHMTKAAELEYLESNVDDERKRRRFTAQEVLYVILATRTLKANRGVGMRAAGVCFTEKTLTALKDTLLGNEARIRRERNAIEWSPYGLMFAKEYLQALGVAPVLQVSPADEGAVGAPLRHRVVSFSDRHSWNHEREWRSADSIQFEPACAVVLVPRFEQIASLQNILSRANISVKGFIPVLDVFACI